MARERLRAARTGTCSARAGAAISCCNRSASGMAGPFAVLSKITHASAPAGVS
jgi:hypothetical protein